MWQPQSKCPECREAIYDDSKPCPHCGSKPKKAGVGRILGIVLALVILAGVAIELASRKDGQEGDAGVSTKDVAELTKTGNTFIEEFAGYLPDDAPGFIYLNVPRLDEQIRSAAVKEGLADASLQALHEAVGRALQKDSDRKAKLLGSLFEFEGTWEDLRELHIAVALLGFDEVKRDQAPRILIAVSPGGALKLFEKYKLRAVLEEIVGAPFREKLIDGVQARYVPVGEGLEVAYGWQGETLLVGFPASSLDEALSNARSGNMTVRSERSYVNLAEEMSHDGVAKAYVNCDALMKSLAELRNLGVDFGDIESRLSEETLPKIALNFDMPDGANLRLWADTTGTRYEELLSWSVKLPSGPKGSEGKKLPLP